MAKIKLLKLTQKEEKNYDCVLVVYEKCFEVDFSSFSLQRY